jgi:hypothetical protein
MYSLIYRPDDDWVQSKHVVQWTFHISVKYVVKSGACKSDSASEH